MPCFCRYFICPQQRGQTGRFIQGLQLCYCLPVSLRLFTGLAVRHRLRCRAGQKQVFLRDGQITAADIGMHAGQRQLRPGRFHAVKRKVKAALVRSGDMKNLLCHAGTQGELHVTGIRAVRIQTVNRRTYGSNGIENTDETGFTGRRTTKCSTRHALPDGADNGWVF
ncbi:hypothetical protein BW31_03017 [Pantoea agglomerans]|nr:hypothetical protein BW31_03017 [Pantoea agglomerans]